MRPLIIPVLLGALMGVRAAARGPDCTAPVSVGLFPPSLFYDAGGAVAYDLLAILARRTGCRFVVRQMPRKRIWKQLQAGELDMTFGLPDPERRMFSWFIPFASMKDVAVFRPDLVHLADIDDILNDEAISVGVVLAHPYSPTIENLIRAIRTSRPGRLSEVSDQRLLLKMLHSNRVQLAFIEEPVYLAAEREGGIGPLASFDPAPYEIPQPHSIALAKAHFGAEEAEKWRTVMADLLADGSLLGLLRKDLTPEEDLRMTLPVQIDLQ